jgi:hypothetical protein
MPLASYSRRRPVEYSILHDAKPAGPPIGTYAGREIAASVIDGRGELYVYAGVAPRRMNGQFNDDALHPGEFIVQPGLVYCLAKMRRSRRRASAHTHQQATN